MAKEVIDITVEILHETENALLVVSGEVEAWIPKSQIEDMTNLSNGLFEIVIPEWIAEDKNLV
jgi:hypothetical protein